MISNEGLIRFRQLTGLRADDSTYDAVIKYEYEHAKARNEYMSLKRILEVISGPK